MKIRSLAVNQFMQFTDPTRLNEVQDGLNVVVGPNELGKTTLLAALRAVLFEKYSSRAKPIASLQNDRNKAGPVVELVFELDDGVYKITKRFMKKQYAELECPDGRKLQADAAEEELRSLLNSGKPGGSGATVETLGMWSVLWVEQGKSFGSINLSDKARTTLHSSLESEVGNVLGGRRARQLPQVIRKRLEELITRGSIGSNKIPRPTGDYKSRIEQSEKLEAELNELHERRRSLSEVLDNLESAENRYKKLSSTEVEQKDKEELADAKAKHSELAKLEANLEAAASELESRKNRLLLAERDLRERTELKNSIKTTGKSVKRNAEALSEIEQQEQEMSARVEDLRVAVREAEGAVFAADEEVALKRRIVALARRDSDLQAMRNRHEKALDAEKRKREAQQKADVILIDDNSIQAIRTMAKEHEEISNKLHAVATQIDFDIESDRFSAIKVGEQSLIKAKSSIKAIESTVIEIADYGKITVDPAIMDREELLHQQQTIHAELENTLESVHAKNLSHSETLYEERKNLLQVVEIARKEVNLYAPATNEYEAGAQSLGDYINSQSKIISREMNDLDLSEVPTQSEAEDALNIAEGKTNEARQMLAIKKADLTGPEETYERTQGELAEIRAQFKSDQENLEALQAQLQKAVEVHTEEKLAQIFSDAQLKVTKQEAIEKSMLMQRSDDTLESFEVRIDRLERGIEDRRKSLARLGAEIAGFRSRLEELEGAGLDEAIAKKKLEFEHNEQTRQRYEREIRVLNLLLETLEEAERDAKERYLSPVVNKLTPYLRLLFPGSNIEFDENLRITGVVREKGYQEDFDRLSMGTQEQIAVLVRLAFGELLVEKGHPATIVLDDALVFSDDQRISSMFDILNQVAKNVQVVVLTCREQLFSSLGGHQLHLTTGNPDELTSA